MLGAGAMFEHHSIPTRAPSAKGVEVDGEAVLLDQNTGALHLLDDMGVAIWSRLDGSRTVGSIVAELSDVHGAEPDRVALDVQEFLARLARLGLLEPVDGGPDYADRGERAREPDGQSSWSLDTIWVDWYTAQVVEALRGPGIEAIVLKGPAIRTWLYHDDPGRRGYLDADLLVAAGALSAAAAVLSELGFEPEGHDETSPWAESWRRAEDGAVVDLHRTLHGCEHSTVDPWPLLRATAVEEAVGNAAALLPSIPARALQIALVSPADRPWQKWDDLERALDQLPLDGWRDTAALARALDVDRLFGYRLCQSPAGAAFAQRIGVPTAPRWWLRWEADPMLRWLALLMEVPGWRARLRLARGLSEPPAGYSPASWALHCMRLIPGAALALLRSLRRA